MFSSGVITSEEELLFAVTPMYGFQLYRAQANSPPALYVLSLVPSPFPTSRSISSPQDIQSFPASGLRIRTELIGSQFRASVQKFPQASDRSICCLGAHRRRLPTQTVD